MSEFKEVSFEECMEHVKTYIHNSDSLEKIQEAYEFASEVHKTQKRNEMTCYENSLQDIKAMLKKNSGYMLSEQFHRIQEDVRNYLDVQT